MDISKQVVILSAERDGDTIENNYLSTRTLKNCLTDCKFDFKEAAGIHKGSHEQSFVVVVKDQEDIETLKDFAFKSFGQESILYQDANQEASLLFSDGSVKRLGRLEQVPKEEALAHDNYTILDDLYYAVKSRF